MVGAAVSFYPQSYTVGKTTAVPAVISQTKESVQYEPGFCSAICYAELKHRLTGESYIPCRAGHVNTETKFVLERFGVKAPRYIKSFEPCLSDVQYRRIPGIDEEMSLHRAWNYSGRCR